MPSTASSWLSKIFTGPSNFEVAGVDARRLHDAAVGGEIAVEHREAAVPGERVLGDRG